MTSKPQTIALLPFAERSADVSGNVIDTQRLSGALMVISRIASVAGGVDVAATIIVEDSADGNAWAEVARFAARAAATVPPDIAALDRVGRFVRARLDIAGAAPRVRHEVLGVLS